MAGVWRKLGSTLALAYAETHPERAAELVLRGIFLFDQYELDWLYAEGEPHRFIRTSSKNTAAPIPETERSDLLSLSQASDSNDQENQLTAAKAWSKWEGEIVKLLPSPSTIEHFT